MYIANTRRVNDRISQMMFNMTLNSMISNKILLPVSDGVEFDNTKELMEAAQRFLNAANRDKVQFTKDEAIMYTMLNALIQSSPVGRTIPLPLMMLFVRESRIFHRGEIESNPYYQNIHFNDVANGNFELTSESDNPYELFMYNTPINYNGIYIPRIAAFDHEFIYPCIKENKQTWMSVTPNEIYTIQPHIKKAKGNVLTLGCGMGYYAYMVSEKENVEHITIIEKERSVIDLFEKHILPQFAHKDKVTIIHADAFDYMKNLDDGIFDVCFADIWIGNMDAAPFLKLYKICKKFKETQISYWIEEGIMWSQMAYVSMLFYEECAGRINIPGPNIKALNSSPASKKQYEFYKELLKDVKIDRPENIDYYLNYKNFLAMI